MKSSSPQQGAFPCRSEIRDVLALVHDEASEYLATLDERPVRSSHPDAATDSFRAPMPDTGTGAAAALREMLDKGMDATIATGGPRCFHFVIGGSTPAALGADWLATALNHNSQRTPSG